MQGIKIARQWKVLLLGPSQEWADAVRTLLQQGAPTVQVFDVRSYPERAAMPGLLQTQPLSVCFLDVSTSPETGLRLIREIQDAAPKLAVIAMLEGNDPDTILRCLRHGALDFLTSPLTVDQFERVLQRIIEAHPELRPLGDQGRVIAVMPAKGGCGASTIAANLSYQRKRFGARKMLLADLDPLTGTLAFQLKAKPTYSFLDALDRQATLDLDVWRSLVTTLEGVDLLASPDTVVEALYRLTDPAPILEFARAVYDHIVVDAANVYGQWNLRLAQLADEILLVAQADAFTLRSVQRCLRYLRRNQIPDARIRLVLNRFARESAMSAEVIQTALQMPVFATSPADPEAIQASLIDGKPVAAGTPFAKAMGVLAQQLSGQVPVAAEPDKKVPAKAAGLAGLLSLLGKRVTS